MALKKIFFFFLLIFLSSCATQVTMTGKAFPPISPSDVKIVFYEKPKCEYEELGFIATPLMWNQTVAIEEARKKAAEIGANYLSIQTINTNQYNDAVVSGLAYYCGVVDRNIERLNKPNAVSR